MGQSPGTAAATALRPPASTARTWVRWSDLKKGKFLDHLAISGDVSAAAALIGVKVSAVYALRRRDAAFARDWQVAVDSGYQLLETLLLGHVLSGAAREAGIAFGAVAWGYASAEAMRAHGAGLVFAGVEDIAAEVLGGDVPSLRRAGD